LVWKNDDLVLYHGCTEQSLKPQNPNGINVGTLPHDIDPFIGALTPDFGPGFYTTTWLDQAKSWANLRAKKLMRRNPDVRAAVLQFAMKRNDLAELEALVFTTEKAGYWPFVSYSRQGGTPHARTACLQPSYDVIYGPVSLATQQFVIKDSDQVSFHTPKAVAKIPVVTVAARGTPLF
jgi:hypothetical protein